MPVVRTVTEILAEIAADTIAEDPDFSHWGLQSANRKTTIPLAIQIQKLETAILAQAYAQNVLTATGADLEAICRDRGLTRLGGSQAEGTVNFVRVTVADEDVVIPAGTEVSAPAADGPPVYFLVDEEVTLVAGQSAVPATVTAVAAGLRGNVRAGSITAITQGLPGIDYCTNPLPFTGGTDTESDDDLRERYIYTALENGRGTAVTIQEHLEALANSDDEAIVDEAKVYNHGGGDVEIVVDAGDVADNEPYISDCIIENLACGVSSRGCLAAYLENGSNAGDLGDAAGGQLWLRALENITAEDAGISFSYVTSLGATHTATATVPAGTVRGSGIAMTLEAVDDEVVSVPNAPTYTGSFTYDVLIGYGDYPYLFVIPEPVAIDVAITYTPTDTPEADLDDLIQASIEAFLDDFAIGETLEFSDLYDAARYQYTKGKGFGVRFEGIDAITALEATDGVSTITALGEEITVETDSRIDPGTVTVTSS